MASTSPEGALYDEGVRMGSWGLLLHCLTSAVYSVIVERLTMSYGYKVGSYTGRHTDIQADTQTLRYTGRHTDTQAHRKTYRHTGRLTDTMMYT